MRTHVHMHAYIHTNTCTLRLHVLKHWGNKIYETQKGKHPL